MPFVSPRDGGAEVIGPFAERRCPAKREGLAHVDEIVRQHASHGDGLRPSGGTSRDTSVDIGNLSGAIRMFTLCRGEGIIPNPPRRLKCWSR